MTSVATWDELKEALESGKTNICLETEDVILATSDINVELKEESPVWVYSPDGNDVISFEYTNFAINIAGKGSIKFENIPFACYSNPCLVNGDSDNIKLTIKNCGFFDGDGETIEGKYEEEKIEPAKGDENVSDADSKEDADVITSKLDENNTVNRFLAGSAKGNRSVSSTYSQLALLINATPAGDTLVLDRDYYYDSAVDGEFVNGIPVDKAITIDGADYTITGSGEARGLYITSDDVVLDRIVFTNCTNTGDFYSYGGAVYIDSSDNITISNSHFINNTLDSTARYINGAAIYDRFGYNLSIINSTFTQNIGGAVYIEGSGSVINSTFINNMGEDGGALYGGVDVENSTFINNTAEYGGAFYSYGGSLINLTFINNTADDNGGAIHFDGAATYADCQDCTFINNRAYYGGAIYAINIEDVTYTNATFVENSAEQGGAIYGHATMADSSFENNTASDCGGAFYVDTGLNTYNTIFVENAAGNYGGGIYVSDCCYDYSNFTFSESVICNNRAGTAGADIYVNASETLSLPDATGFNRTYQDTGVQIDGWYYDEEGSRYNETGNMVPAYYSDSPSGAFAVVAAYGDNTTAARVTPRMNATAEYENGVLYLATYFEPSNVTGNVTYSINGENGTTYYGATIVDGVAVMNQTVSLPSGNYTVRATYTGDEDFAPATTTTVVEIGGNTYSDLAALINATPAGETLVLDRDYHYDPNIDGSSFVYYGIYVRNAITIDGNNHTISGSGVAVGLNITSSNVVLDQMVFTNCVNYDVGGAVHMEDVGNVTISNSYFINNTAHGRYHYIDGGTAVCCAYGSASIINSTFIQNTGGAVALFSSSGSVVNSTFINNENIQEGNVYYYEYCGGALSISHGIVENSTFINNTSGKGGAIYMDYYGTRINDSTFINNTADDSGGALYVERGFNSYNSTFINNNAGNYGGGIYVAYSYDEDFSFTDDVICNNKAGVAGADVYIDDPQMLPLPDASEFNTTYEDTGVQIDGWYYDEEGSRYDARSNAVSANLSDTPSKSVALVAAHRELAPTYDIYIDNEVAATVEENGTFTLPTSGQYYHELGYVDNNNQSLVYKPGANLTVNGSVNLTGLDNMTVTQTQGASIKMDIEHSGIAFEATAHTNDEAPIKSSAFTYGMLITTFDMYSEYLDYEMTLESKENENANVMDITFGENDWIDGQGGIYRAGVLDVSDQNLRRAFISRGYATINYTDGSSRSFYAPQTSGQRSIQWVAEKIKTQRIDYYNSRNASERAALDKFAVAQ